MKFQDGEDDLWTATVTARVAQGREMAQAIADADMLVLALRERMAEDESK